MPITPIDTSIPLQVRQVQQPNLLQEYGQIQAIKNAQQQGEAGALQLEQQKREMAGQQAIQRAFLESKGDLKATIPLAAQYGATASQISGLQKNMLDHVEKMSKIDEAQLKLSKERMSAVSGAAQQVLDAKDPAQQDAVYAQARQSLASMGIPADQLPPQLPPPGPDRDVWLQTHAAAATSAIQLTDQALKKKADERAQIESAQKTELHPGAVTEQGLAIAGKTQANTQAAALAPGAIKKQGLEITKAEQETTGEQPMSPYQAAMVDNAKRNKTEDQLQFEAAKGRRPDASEEDKKIGAISADALKVKHAERVQVALASKSNNIIQLPANQQNLTGDAYVATLPQSLRPSVEAVLEGRLSPNRGTWTAQYRQAVMQAVTQADPDWSEQRAAVRKAFTTGKEGTTIGNLNTAPVHLAQLDAAADALKNGQIQPGNQLYNYLSTTFGAAAPTNFDGVRNAAAGEIASALKGTATDIEIESIKKTINKAQSPEQLQGIIKEYMGVLATKLNTYDERFHAENTGDTKWSPIKPTAKAIFDAYGVDPKAKTMGGGAKNGSRIKIISVE